MKHSEALSIGDLFKMMMDSSGDTVAFNRQKAAYMWSEIVGPTINRATIRRYVEGDILHVWIDSAPLKSDLAFSLPRLITHINEAVGAPVIKKIVIH